MKDLQLDSVEILCCFELREQNNLSVHNPVILNSDLKSISVPLCQKAGENKDNCHLGVFSLTICKVLGISKESSVID